MTLSLESNAQSKEQSNAIILPQDVTVFFKDMKTHENLQQCLSSLQLKSFAKHYQYLAEIMEKEGQSHIQYLQQLTLMEIEQKSHDRLQKLIQGAKLPRNKHLKDFDVTRVKGLSKALIERLATGDFMEDGSNIVIFGTPGTGKTHLCIGLSREWCLRGRRVLFLTAAKLLEELKIAHNQNKLQALLKRLDKYQCLVIDDISYIPLERTDADLIFQLISHRYEQSSLVITSNVPFGKWTDIFKDNMTTAAVVDRLIHHSEIIELNAESYRLKESKMAKEKKQNLSEPEAKMG